MQTDNILTITIESLLYIEKGKLTKANLFKSWRYKAWEILKALKIHFYNPNYYIATDIFYNYQELRYYILPVTVY